MVLHLLGICPYKWNPRGLVKAALNLLHSIEGGSKRVPLTLSFKEHKIYYPLAGVWPVFVFWINKF